MLASVGHILWGGRNSFEQQIEVDTAKGVARARTKPAWNRNVGIRLFNDDSNCFLFRFQCCSLRRFRRHAVVIEQPNANLTIPSRIFHPIHDLLCYHKYGRCYN